MKNGDMPAFGELEQVGNAAIKSGGLTKREYFVGLMIGLAGSLTENMSIAGGRLCLNLADDAEWTSEHSDMLIAKKAIELADALLKQLEETK